MVSGDVAQMVVDAAADGRMERAAPVPARPRSPWVSVSLDATALQPWLEAKGRRVQARLKAEAEG